MKTHRYALTAAAALAAFLVDLAFGARAGASLLPALLLALGMVQGALALAAAAELSRGKWIEPLREHLLDLQPLLLLGPLGFLAWARHLALYGWDAAPNAWLNPPFFTGRNLALTTLAWLLAGAFAGAVRKGSPRRGVWAVLYLLTFVFCQSMAGFDWVMSFDYPWVGTLFGPYFFIEALYLGIGLAVLLAFRAARAGGAAVLPARKDTVTLLFGFSLLWAGQFFAQYLTIWYGNIPEEVDYLVKRFHMPGMSALGTAFLLMMFAVPFVVLISRRAKETLVAPAVVLVTWLGYLLEKVFMLAPSAPLNAAAVAVLTVILLVPAAAVIRGPSGSGRRG